MTVVAVSMMRDEADVAGHVVRHLYRQGVDLVVVADNLSEDGTGNLARDAGAVVLADDDLAYEQDRKMTTLARIAYGYGATWVLPFDADEHWYPLTHDSIGEALASVPDNVDVVAAGGWDHIATPNDPPDEPNPFARICWRRPETQRLPKVAFRAAPDRRLHMGNHDVDPPGLTRTTGTLAYRHYQYRTLEQMTRKLRNGREAYEASTVHEMHGTHWREGGLLTDEELAEKWDALCATAGLIFDPAPHVTSQEAAA